jgi:hypothetical protein
MISNTHPTFFAVELIECETTQLALSLKFKTSAKKMQHFTQTYQYYVDDFDRRTIRELKNFEKNFPADFHLLPAHADIEIFHLMRNDNAAIADFFSRAFDRARIRDHAIASSKQRDIEKDKLVRDFPIPAGVLCNQCKKRMAFETFIFKEGFEERILFVFSCSDHSRKKIVYPNGEEYIFKTRKCKKCGGELAHKSEEKGNILILTDICTCCGETEVMELEGPDEEFEIITDERQKYCLQFEGIGHFFEDLKAIGEFSKNWHEREAERNLQKQYEVDKIKKINVPALENLLKKEIESCGFTKFEFAKTELGRPAIVTFTIQDPTERNNSESSKTVVKLVNKALIESNWRLVSNSVDYRLGILTGRLRAYETDEDLLKLAQSIQKKKAAKE